MEIAICHTFDLLIEFGKLEDAKGLVDGSLQMLMQMKEKPEPQSKMNDTSKASLSQAAKSNKASATPVTNNLPLEYALSTC